MNIKECGFTKKNLLFAVLEDGTVLLGNLITGKIYKVVDVEPAKYANDRTNVTKISIDEFKPKKKRGN